MDNHNSTKKLHFTLDLNSINSMQLETMRKAIERAKHAHYTNIEVRINGEYEYVEADWLKHFIEIPIVDGD